MRKMLVVALLVLSLILGGCWDMIDVEKKAYVMGLVIQSSTGTPLTQSSPALKPEDKEDYYLTLQVILPKNLAGKEGGGGGDQKPVWVLSGTGKTIFEVMRGIVNRTESPLGLSHLRVIILSEEIARGGITEVMDFFARRFEVGFQSAILVVPSGEADNILQVQPKIENIGSIYLFNQMEQATKFGKSVSVKLGNLYMNLREGTNFVLPRVVPGKDELQVAGGTVFKQDRMVGWLGESDLRGYLWVTDQMQNGMMTVGPFSYPPDPNVIFTYEITEAKRKIRPHVSDGKVSFTVNISTEGTIGEVRGNYYTNPMINAAMEKEVTKAIKEQIEHAILRMQEMGVDIFGFESELKKRYPMVAEKLNWDEEFPNAEVAVNVKVFIRRTGLAGRTKK